MKGEKNIIMKYFISDIHFGEKKFTTSKNLNGDKNKLYSLTLDEYDKFIIDNWNNRVNDNDDVYIVGDLSWYKLSKTISLVKQLKGKKHLIVGNHDERFLDSKEFCKLFIEIKKYKELYINDYLSIILCHYPIPAFKNAKYGWIHLYGHVHNGSEWDIIERTKTNYEKLYRRNIDMYNVGIMLPYIDFYPRTISEIKRGYCEVKPREYSSVKKNNNDSNNIYY